MAKKIFLRDENNNKVLPITRGELVLDSSGNPAFHSNEFLATDSQPGLMSHVDKQKLETIAGNTIDTELSNTSTNPVQNKVLTQIINSIREKYLKSAVVSGNKVTITDQSNNTVEFVNSTYQIVTNAVDGLVPKYDAVDGTIDTQTTDWVLTNHNGTLGWYKLPTAAFSSSSVQLFVGAKSTSNNNNSNSATTNGNTYLKLFDNSTLKNQYHIKGTGLATVLSDANGTITINVPTSHNQASSDINNLTGYAKATAISALTTTDTLNTALGKLELKADTTYELVKGAYDGDGTIENLTEILKVLEGIKDTDTIQTIVDKYLPLSGGIINSNEYVPLTIRNKNLSEVWIGFEDSGGISYIGSSQGVPSIYLGTGSNKTILHSGNSYINNGTITINGTSITPLTQHQDLSNYVTLNTAQTITGSKTFTSLLKLNTTSAAYVQYLQNNVVKAEVGWHSMYGVFIKNETSQKFLNITDTGIPKFDGNTLWHAGNDGNGSGLDADLLDGYHASAFATSGHNHDSTYVKYGKVSKSTADSANATPYLYNVEGEEVISGYYSYWYMFNMGQYSRGNFGTQLAMPYQDSLTDSELFIRSAKSGTWRSWRRVLHSNNYTDYTVKKDGTGASGTWGINITGNADKLDGYHAGLTNNSVAIFVPFPGYTSLKNSGYIDANYGIGSYGYPDNEFLKGICKWAIATYPNQGDITLMGVISPNSSGTCILHLYSSAGKDSSTLLPKYCRGQYLTLSGELYNFGTVNYVWSYIRFALTSDIKNPIDYYWANVPISATSNSSTSPTFNGVYASFMELSRTTDHGLKVGSIRGTAVGSRTGQYIHMYERVHIGSPSGWGSNDAPSCGLSTYGGAWLATNGGNVGIGTTNPSTKLHLVGDFTTSGDIYYTGSLSTNRMIRFLNNTADAYGNGIEIGGGGLTVVGGGEAASLVSASIAAGVENLVLCADEIIEFYSNCQTALSDNYKMVFDKVGDLSIASSLRASGVYANRTGATNSGGISLYSNSDPDTYGIMFRGTAHCGTHGKVTSDWATYFTMNNQVDRGWIFRRGTTNVASISGGGAASFTAVGTDKYMAYPQGGQYTYLSGDIRGAIKIKLPVSKSSTMMSMTITIYNYSTGTSTTYYVGGYNYSDGNWYNEFAYSNRQGLSDYGNLPVSFGNDGYTDCIYIGETTTYWSYPNIVVSNVLLGHNTQYVSSWATGWEISITTSLGNINKTVTNPATNEYTKYARYVIADNNAKDPEHALLQSGSGRKNASPDGDTWIYWDALGGTSAPWGFKHEQASNLISFYGDGIRRAYIDLSNGNASVYNLNVRNVYRQLYSNSANGTAIHSILNYSTSPYGLLTRIYNDGCVSLQSQRETTSSEYFVLSLNPLGGNVGINKTNPAYTLDVSGKIRATSRIYANEWIQLDTASGLYWPNTYGAHFYPNETSTYGQFQLLGTKGTYSGIHFGNTKNYLTVMSTDLHHGLYCENFGWEFYFRRDNGYVGLRTSTIPYPISMNGDSYTTGWSRAASGFYIEDTGVHYTHQGSVGEIDMNSNNEFLWGSSNADLYFNYRPVSRGTTVTNYIWNAGSSSSYATHRLGSIHIHSNGSSYNESIRIHPSSAGWHAIVLCGTDNTGNSGVSANTWGIYGYDGTMYINKATSNGATNARAMGTSTGWTFGNTDLNSYALNAASFICDSWIRTCGATGWYNESYGGGWYMEDNTYVRVYNDKRVYNNNSSQYAFYTAGGMTALGHMYSNSEACSWIDGQNGANAALNIGDATDTGSYWPWMRQTNTQSSKWFSVGTLDNSLYFIGSATSRTSNGYDYGFRMDFSNGYLYGNFSGYLSGTAYRADRLRRRDSSDNYSVQTHWTGSYWYLRGYTPDDVYHAGCQVDYANSAGNADTVDNYHISVSSSAGTNSNTIYFVI